MSNLDRSGRDDDGGGRPGTGTRRVRLVRDGATLLVTPIREGRRRGGRGGRREGLVLPKLPLSLVHWLSALGRRFRVQRSASLAIALLLDPLTRRWIPLLPHQRCGRRRAHWSPGAEDFAGEPGHLLLAGSFQTVLARDPPGDALAAALAAVPGFDGLHVVERHGGAGTADAVASLALLRVGGEVHVADPSGVLVGDLEETLRRYAHRLRPA